MIKNFVITAYGRSGTKFLAELMNRSEKWDVRHEARGNKDEFTRRSKKVYCEKVLNPFFDKVENYGEVNGKLRFYIKDLPVDKKGIIFRNPLEVFLSAMNRKNHILQYNKIVDDIFNWYYEYLHYVQSNDTILPISFKKMTQDIVYLENLLHEFDIYDVQVNKADLTRKVNQNQTVKFKTYEDLPENVKRVAKKLEYFNNIEFKNFYL